MAAFADNLTEFNILDRSKLNFQSEKWILFKKLVTGVETRYLMPTWDANHRSSAKAKIPFLLLKSTSIRRNFF